MSDNIAQSWPMPVVKHLGDRPVSLGDLKKQNAPIDQLNIVFFSI
jgi:hypothetical protein